MQKIIQEFTEFLIVQGARIEGAAIMDGRFHRVALNSDKANEKNASYKGWLDGRAAGLFHNFALDTTETWKSSAEPRLSAPSKCRDVLSPSKMIEDKDALERSRAKTAYGVVRNAAPAGQQHPYFVAKKINAPEFKHHINQVADIGDGLKLLVPLHDMDMLWSFQTISNKGDKFFLKGAKKHGCFFSTFGFNPVPEKINRVYICEGYATGVSVSTAINQNVFCAMDAGNLLPVALELKHYYPESEFVFLSDNDIENKLGNVGMIKAQAAANAVQGIVYPPPKINHREYVDWNDLMQDHGLIAIREAFEVMGYI